MKGIRLPIVKSEYDRTWQKHCGFLDLTIEQFMAVQEALLERQVTRMASFPLGRKLMGERPPRSLDEFLHRVPLTTYADYESEFRCRNSAALAEEPLVWAQTSAADGSFKYIPYTRRFYEHALELLMSAFILSCSHRRGQSDLVEGDRVLFNVAPQPYLSGILAAGACRSFDLKPVLEAGEHDALDFRDKVARGFEQSLKTGVDVLVAMTSVLVKMGRDFADLSHGGNGRGRRRTVHPAALYRYASARLRSRLEKRSIRPADLWPVKSIIGWGIDTRIYREEVHNYWGCYPYEMHACTEAGIIALQAWDRHDLTLVPTSNFFEFIPEEEWLACKDNLFAQPRTVLLPDVVPGERYELVITGFFGMPFLRYRLGHFIRVTALEDAEAGIRLPQIVFEARADDLIDIGGFTRISEKTIASAIAAAGLRCEDWLARREIDGDRVRLSLYIEANGHADAAALGRALQRELTRLDPGYRDLERMLEVRPLEVTLLRPGTFSRYYDLMRAEGAELLQRKPPRMNASDDVVGRLLRLSKESEVAAGKTR